MIRRYFNSFRYDGIIHLQASFVHVLLNLRLNKRTLDDQIKAAVDAEDANDMKAGESEQPKKVVSKPTESELVLLFQNLSTGGIVFR